jgi:hypothetical protein
MGFHHQHKKEPAGLPLTGSFVMRLDDHADGKRRFYQGTRNPPRVQWLNAHSIGLASRDRAKDHARVPIEMGVKILDTTIK